MSGSWLQALSPGLRLWAPPPRRVRYARTGTAGNFELPRVIIEEDWGEPLVDDDGVAFRRVAQDADSGKLIEDAQVHYGPAGLADVGTYDADTLMAWDTPQVVLPAEPAVGMSWSAVHTRADTSRTRSVELLDCTAHKHCLVSVSETTRPDGVLIMRNHYARDEGWHAFEALVNAPGRLPVRMWSEAVTLVGR